MLQGLGEVDRDLMWGVGCSVQGGHIFFDITETPKNFARIAIVECVDKPMKCNTSYK